MTSDTDNTYRAPIGFRNRHVQTIWGPLINPLARCFATTHRRVPWTLHRVPTPDGDTIRVHHFPGDCRPTDVFAGPWARRQRKRGLHADLGQVPRQPWMGCGSHGTPVLWRHESRPASVSFGSSDDIGVAIRYLQKLESAKRTDRPTALVGFSLGGNQVLKWLGQDHAISDLNHIFAAAAISAPFNAGASAPYIAKSLGGFYARIFLKTLIPKVIAKAKQHPHLADTVLDLEAVKRASSFKAFDDAVTAPLHGYENAQHYWEATSCRHHLGQIRVPTLLLSSRDDPFNPAHTFPTKAVKTNPNLFPRLTHQGGHVGFWQGRRARRRNRSPRQAAAPARPSVPMSGVTSHVTTPSTPGLTSGFTPWLTSWADEQIWTFFSAQLCASNARHG